MTEQRRREVIWADPRETTQAASAMAGLDFLRAMRDGAVPPPPAIVLLGIAMREVEPGRVVMHMPAGEHLYNPLGTVHGGMITTLLDSVMGCAVHSTLPPGRGFTTLELKVNFVRAATVATGTLMAEGVVAHAGRQTALAEARLTGPDGRLHATASSTCLIFDMKG